MPKGNQIKMCDLKGLSSKDLTNDERAMLSGMTSDDIENMQIFQQYELEQQTQQQGAVRMESKLCTDIFSDAFLDIEKVEEATTDNGFEFNVKSDEERIKGKYLSYPRRVDDDDDDGVDNVAEDDEDILGEDCENFSGVVKEAENVKRVRNGKEPDETLSSSGVSHKSIVALKSRPKALKEDAVEVCEANAKVAALKTSNVRVLAITSNTQQQQLAELANENSIAETEDSHINDICRIMERAKPAKKRPAKRRPRRKEEWKVNKRKLKRNSGQEYINRNGNPVAAKEFKNKPCNCRMQCNTKFTQSERKLLFDTFWDLQDFNLQNISLHGRIRAVEVAQHRDKSLIRPRFKTFHYYLQPNASADEERVCKRYFLETFQVSHGRVYRCVSKPELEAVVDHRGKPGNNTEQRRLQRTHVQEHIEQFALYKEKFLSSSLTIRNMYDLYVEECRAQNMKPLSQTYYHQMMDTMLSVKLHKDDKQLQRRRKKALLKRLYTREELVKMLGTLLRQSRNKQLQKAAG